MVRCRNDAGDRGFAEESMNMATDADEQDDVPDWAMSEEDDDEEEEQQDVGTDDVGPSTPTLKTRKKRPNTTPPAKKAKKVKR